MKIKMKEDAHHRISSAISQAFKAGETYSVPQVTGNSLVDRGVAEVIGGKKPSTKRRKDNGDG